MRKVDIAHSRQTVPEAMEQLGVEIKNARRVSEDALLVVHGYGASGIGGEIKAALATELPRLARLFNFRTYGYEDRDGLPAWLESYRRSLSLGSTIVAFREGARGRESRKEFRPNFRNLRTRVIVRPSVSDAASSETCRHAKRQLMFRGPDGNTYKCRQCGETFMMRRTAR
jgi:hypothetical protein